MYVSLRDFARTAGLQHVAPELSCEELFCCLSKEDSGRHGRCPGDHVAIACWIGMIALSLAEGDGASRPDQSSKYAMKACAPDAFVSLSRRARTLFAFTDDGCLASRNTPCSDVVLSNVSGPWMMRVLLLSRPLYSHRWVRCSERRQTSLLKVSV